jgi:hypothetical protein
MHFLRIAVLAALAPLAAGCLYGDAGDRGDTSSDRGGAPPGATSCVGVKQSCIARTQAPALRSGTTNQDDGALPEWIGDYEASDPPPPSGAAGPPAR